MELNGDAPAPPRRRLSRGVVILPSAFTLGNLFLGMWAIVSASRGAFEMAGWLIVAAAVADLLDGRIARFTATGTAFGEELDSLVDAISFGVAPAMIVYFVFLREGEWSWVLGFLYVVAAVLRLARFNIEQAGTAKSHFHGLPSPTAGSVLATFYPFTQSPLWQAWFPNVSVGRTAGWLTLAVGVLMVSNVLYPVVPRFSLRTWGGRFALLMATGAVVSVFTRPEYFFFPVGVAYILYGLSRSVVMGLMDRLPDRDPLLDEPDGADGEDDDRREVDYDALRPGRARRPRFSRRKRKDGP